jgi:hypothetical protein
VTDSPAGLLLVGLPLLTLWVLVIVDVLAQPDLGRRAKTAWILACTLLWPAMVLYLLARPQQARITRPEVRSDPHATLVATVLDLEAGRLDRATGEARLRLLRHRTMPRE